jgi:uncharacterized protein (DUF2461 family)
MGHQQKAPAVDLMKALLQQQQRRQHLGAAYWKLRQHLEKACVKEIHSSPDRSHARTQHQRLRTEQVMAMLPEALTTAAVSTQTAAGMSAL